MAPTRRSSSRSTSALITPSCQRPSSGGPRPPSTTRTSPSPSPHATRWPSVDQAATAMPASERSTGGSRRSLRRHTACRSPQVWSRSPTQVRWPRSRAGRRAMRSPVRGSRSAGPPSPDTASRGRVGCRARWRTVPSGRSRCQRRAPSGPRRARPPSNNSSSQPSASRCTPTTRLASTSGGSGQRVTVPVATSPAASSALRPHAQAICAPWSIQDMPRSAAAHRRSDRPTSSTTALPSDGSPA